MKHGRNHHLVGSALHNIGVINLWAGRFKDAFIAFDTALRIRITVLPPNHLSTIVSTTIYII